MKKFELSIPKPCHENWNAMTPNQQGRFCGACQKTVIDFSSMSDRQVAEFFKKPLGTLCGRLHPDQLERTFEMPAKRIPWLKYFFTVSLPALLFSLRATAQREMVGKIAVVKEKQWIDSTTSPQEKVIHKPVTKGRIAIRKPARLKIVAINTDSSLFANPPSCVQPKVIAPEKRAIVNDQLIGTLGGVMFIRPVSTNKKKIAKEMPVKKVATPIVSFSVYPNPVVAGGTISIHPGGIEIGSYEYAVLNSTGEMMQKGDVQIENNNRYVSVHLTHFSAGPYFLRLMNSKTKKYYTEIIIVQ